MAFGIRIPSICPYVRQVWISDKKGLRLLPYAVWVAEYDFDGNHPHTAQNREAVRLFRSLSTPAQNLALSC